MYRWKLVHGDVFRAPRALELLAALVGTGVQLALLVLSVILITIAGAASCMACIACLPGGHHNRPFAVQDLFVDVAPAFLGRMPL